jgi:hypothetical protein
MDAVKVELTQLHEYNTFKDLGYKADAPSGYKKICTHLVFDCKHDGRHKAHMVADRQRCLAKKLWVSDHMVATTKVSGANAVKKPQP